MNVSEKEKLLFYRIWTTIINIFMFFAVPLLILVMRFAERDSILFLVLFSLGIGFSICGLFTDILIVFLSIYIQKQNKSKKENNIK